MSAPATPIEVPIERLPRELAAARQAHAALQADQHAIPGKMKALTKRVAAGDMTAVVEEARLRVRLEDDLPAELEAAATRIAELEREYAATLTEHNRRTLAAEVQRTEAPRDRLADQFRAALETVERLAGAHTHANRAAAHAVAAAAGNADLAPQAFAAHSLAGYAEAIGAALASWMACWDDRNIDRPLIQRITDARGRAVQAALAAFDAGGRDAQKC